MQELGLIHVKGTSIGPRKEDFGKLSLKNDGIIAVSIIIIALLQAAPLFGASPGDIGFKILHTADSWGEISPCG